MSVSIAVLPPVLKVAVILLLLFSFLYYLARDVLLLLPDSWCELSVDQGEVSVILRDKNVLIGKVADGTFVSPFFVLLRIKLDGKRWALSRVIYPDALLKDGFRDLCVRLRLG